MFVESSEDGLLADPFSVGLKPDATKRFVNFFNEDRESGSGGWIIGRSVLALAKARRYETIC